MLVRVAIAFCLTPLGAAACVPRSAHAQDVRTVEGPAEVIDGDGLRIDGVAFRLYGIDAVEGRQTCARNGETWACGEASADALRALVAGQVVRCEPEDRDRYDRLVSTCFLPDGTDVNQAQVAGGWAVAYTDFSTRYVEAEAGARSAGLGIWSSEFARPEDWRAAGRDASAPALAPSAATPTARGGCVIKGNISQSSGARIFHVPGQADYEATRIDEARGERWFCTEEAAVAAGWRKARR